MSISQEHLYEYKIAKYNTKLQAMRGGLTFKDGMYAFVVNRKEALEQIEPLLTEAEKKAESIFSTAGARERQLSRLQSALKGTQVDLNNSNTVSIDILNTAWSKIGYRIDLSPSAIRKGIQFVFYKNKRADRADIDYAADLIETNTDTLARVASCGIKYPATLRLPDLKENDISDMLSKLSKIKQTEEDIKKGQESMGNILKNVNTALDTELKVTNRFVLNSAYALDTVLIIDVSIANTNKLLSVYTTNPAKPA